ncbi:Zonular occludens toxin [Rheinheimera sp. YQF-2]|uniref:Zonular occludens toxin n=1 Tax=Rheinheimera lutimaris TaxID=2740584 RepID=A0A7Y5AQD2_9GAMM|nr:zonular occludens toxin domain-containing protein [Rheinheimera lutimaris]NRQ42611.1 Zonular occludens toxin [Rheinheimera lutimaris]
MIIFHEGLPRSGKSYEALVKWIIPAIKKGRKVYARINGLNYEKIAELCDITLERCQELLIHIPKEQVMTIYEHISNDALVIIDELQNFCPNGRQKLTPEMTAFIAEHGHKGLDIVTMGQSLSDCHSTWRNRTERKIQFLKLSMLGLEKRYQWTSYQGINQANGSIKFVKSNTGTATYDQKYFGAYASHEDDTENKGNLADARLNVFSSKALRYGIPLAIVAAGYAVYYLYGFFNPASVKAEPVAATQLSTVPQQKTAEAKLQVRSEPVRPSSYDFVQSNTERYSAKLTYMAGYHDYIQDFLVVWEDSSGRIMDQLYYGDFKQAGYTASAKGSGVEVSKGNVKLWFRFMPPHESYGRVPVQTQEQLVTSL